MWGLGKKQPHFGGLGKYEGARVRVLVKWPKNCEKVSEKSEVSEYIYLSTTFDDFSGFVVCASIHRLISTIFRMKRAEKQKGVSRRRGQMPSLKIYGGGIDPIASPPIYYLQNIFTHHF